MDFVTGFPISIDWKGDSYNFILVIVDRLTKVLYYKLVQVMIDVASQTEVIIEAMIRHHGLSDPIVSDRKLVFTTKF